MNCTSSLQIRVDLQLESPLTSQITYHEQLQRFDDRERFVRSWIADAELTRAHPNQIVMGVIHGLGDHGGRFDAMARWMAARGIHVYTFDQVGHGQTPGKRMAISSYDELLRDIDHFVQHLQHRHTDSKVGLFGQSMGGNLVLNHQLRSSSRTAWIVASSPMIRAINEPGTLYMAVLRALAAIAPHYRLKTPADPTALTRDANAQAAFLEDPLVQKCISLRLGGALIDSGRWALQNAEQLTTPTLIAHGDADRITSHQASMDFAKRSRAYSEIKIWPGGLHDLHHDIVCEDFFQHIFGWIQRQSSANVSVE